MSVSLIQSPPVIYPTHSINGNPVVFSSSTASNDANYKYVVDLYVEEPSLGTGAGTFAKINRQAIWPNPIDSRGYYSPQGLLMNYVSSEVHPFITSSTANTTSIRYYKLAYGEEFSTTQLFQNTSEDSSFLKLNFLSAAVTGVTVGDEVSIRLDNSQFNSQYNGTWLVLSATSSTLILDCPFGVIAEGESGYMYKILTVPNQTSALSVWNGAKQYSDANLSFPSTYQTGSSSRKFLTDYIGEYRITTNEPRTLSFIQSGTNITKYVVKTYDSSNTLIGNFDLSISSSGSKRKDIPAGTWNLSQVTGTNQVTTNTETVYTSAVAYYTIQLFNSSTPITEIKTFRINTSCSKFERYYFCFVDRLRGGTEYLTANYKSTYTQKIKRETYDRVLPYNYTIGSRSKTITNIEVEEVVNVWTDWMNEQENYLIESLYSSNDVYLMDVTNHTKTPIIILQGDYRRKTVVNNKLISYPIAFTYSSGVVTQY